VDYEVNRNQPNEENGNSPWLGILIISIVLIVIAGLVVSVIALVNHPEQTESLRDVVIIFVAVESLIIGIALILLIIQIARLTAIIQNEVKPLIDSGNETINTLRGTSQFLSDKMVRPVITMNSTFAAIRRAVDLIKSGLSKPH
jgi:heme/copper-type cytochrome/quinol oxidase subunit 2